MSRARRQIAAVPAFTVVEALAVIALLALVVGAVSWTLSSAARAGTIDQLVQELAYVDSLARGGVRTGAAGAVVRFDLDQNRYGIAPSRNARPEPWHGLPRGLTVASVRTTQGLCATQGVAEVPVSSTGQTGAYALEVRGQDRTSAGVSAKSWWIVVAGVTGDLLVTDSESHAFDILWQLAAQRVDAD